MTSRHPSAISTDTITTGSSATSMVTDRTTVFRTFHILYWGSKINRRSLGLDRAERSLKQRLDLSVQEKPPGAIRGAFGLREWWREGYSCASRSKTRLRRSGLRAAA